MLIPAVQNTKRTQDTPHLSMRDKLFHHLLQRILIIHDHLSQPWILPVTAAHTHNAQVYPEWLQVSLFSVFQQTQQQESVLNPQNFVKDIYSTPRQTTSSHLYRTMLKAAGHTKGGGCPLSYLKHGSVSVSRSPVETKLQLQCRQLTLCSC